MTFRKILSVLLAAAMLSCLAACGETGPADPGAVTSENPAADGSGSEGGGGAETEADVLAPYKSIDLGGRTVTRTFRRTAAVCPPPIPTSRDRRL